MSGFRVLELEAANSRTENIGARWTFDDRTGLYKLISVTNNRVIDGSTNRGFYDLVFSGDPYRIYKVLCTNNNRIFQLGDTVTADGTNRVIVTQFTVRENRVHINNTLLLANARPYVAPVVTVPVQQASNTNNFRELEERITRDRVALKLGSNADGFVNPVQSLDQFLINFFTTYNNRYATFYVETNRQQTTAGRRRSLGDIFMICKQYYPSCTLHDVIKSLYVTLPAASALPNLASLICSQINKRVWWLYTGPRFDHATNNDEYGHDKAWYIENLNRTPVVEIVDASTDDEDDMVIFERVKTQFPVGTRFRSLGESRSEFRVDSNSFYNGVTSIIQISRDGGRRKIYDKTTRRTAQIITR